MNQNAKHSPAPWRIDGELNEYENGVLKPARAAIAQAEGGAQ